MKSSQKTNKVPKYNTAPCPIFRDMTIDEREQVLLLLEHETYGKGEVILREGNSHQILWILVHGKCEVVKNAKHGATRQLATLEPGAVFGEMSFFEKAPHSASIRALTDVEVMRLSREKYDHLRDTGSLAACKIAASVNLILAQRLRRMDEWTCTLLESPDVADHREEWQEFRAKLYSDWQF
jgi:CRP-like cAMP-binding protein